MTMAAETDVLARELLSPYDCELHKHFCDLESTRCEPALAGGACSALHSADPPLRLHTHSTRTFFNQHVVCTRTHCMGLRVVR
jgi:hypothetical protein